MNINSLHPMSAGLVRGVYHHLVHKLPEQGRGQLRGPGVFPHHLQEVLHVGRPLLSPPVTASRERMVAAPPMLIHPEAVDSCGLRGFRALMRRRPRRPCPLSLGIPGFSHVLPSCPAFLSYLVCSHPYLLTKKVDAWGHFLNAMHNTKCVL